MIITDNEEGKIMKFARNISLFIVLALLVTIGGVYAAWVYPADNAAVGSATKTFTGNMTQVDTQATSKGNISVDTTTDTLKIFVDDKGGYVAAPKAQGSITVCFKPEPGVSTEIKDNGIDMEIAISITGNQDTVKDDGDHDVKIFAVKQAVLPLNKAEKGADGSFRVDVAGEDILDCLDFCKSSEDAEPHTVTLETLEENKDFGLALNTYTINLTIREVDTTNP